ncbi:MAG TPA: arabinofuranosidase catalytic domain-containing protein, partial [Polyangiaceae bacterium]
QDSFCGTEVCTVSMIYDQSGRGNHLKHAPPDCYLDTDNPPSNESAAKGRSLTVGGHEVYGLYMSARDGYRDNETTGMPIGSEAQGIYEVVDGKRVGDACCWDFGNGSTNNCTAALGSMNALLFGKAYWGKGADGGPWFLGDFEGGAWAGGSGASSFVNLDNPTADYDYALGLLKTTATTYALRVGNAQAGGLVTAYYGAIPFASWTMKGGIILGLGEDGSNSSFGTFFEGAITAGRPSDATDAAILSNVQAAKYGQ